jgi:hypothetical protein
MGRISGPGLLVAAGAGSPSEWSRIHASSHSCGSPAQFAAVRAVVARRAAEVELARAACDRPADRLPGDQVVHLEPDQLGRESGEPLGLPLGISVFDHDVATLDVTEIPPSLTDGLGRVGGQRPG